MADSEVGKSARKTSAFGVGHVFIIAQSITAILLVSAAVALILLWLISVLLSFTPANGLMPWVAAGVSEFGLLFVILPAIPGIPGIIWVSWLSDRANPPWDRILKMTAWIGKLTFKVGASAAIVFLILVIVIGFGGANQPESIKYVAAYEIPLPTEADRDEFLLVLGAAAKAEGMHVDVDGKESLQKISRYSPNFQMSMNASVWRGPNNHELIARAMDQTDHLGQVWLMFCRGESPETNVRFRERAMRDIMQRWPGTLSLPITSTGGVPSHSDLVRTNNGYIVKPSEAIKYGLSSGGAPPQ